LSLRGVFMAAAAAAAFCADAQDGERAPFITTPSDVVERMLRFAGTGPADLVVDLGSGDGRIVIAAARAFGARGLGIELDRALVEKSRDNARAAGVAERVSFVHGNVLFAGISQASVVTVYLLPGLINQLQPRFLDELKPGTRIVSHAFTMAGWKPDRAETVRLAQRHPGQGDESAIFLWIVPAKARGRWAGSGAGGDLRLTVRQNFQEIEVEGMAAGKPLADVRASLSGNDIAWEARGVRFRGRVEGERIAGELSRDGSASPLELKKLP
jgi:protein-L-isoaspartate O-methyltransferase